MEVRTDEVEVIQAALVKLIEERKRDSDAKSGDPDEQDQQLLFRLLNHLESLKEGNVDPSITHSVEEKQPITSSEVTNSNSKYEDKGTTDDIMRELKAVKRQNLITHCLLSVVIVVTIVWQLSEVSFLLSMKNKVSHPIRSIWNAMEGALKGKGKIQDPNKHTLIEASPLPPLSVPELPHVDLPALPFNNGQ